MHPEGWEIKGSATEFDEEVWYKTLGKALYMDELITRHGNIMDQYDPEKKIGMIVDEWGTWYTCEPGTNPGFLYQQNTVRDALVAGITLNIFNRHSDRVKLCCLAQMVNVLQAVLLTEGENLVKTPTYHVFHQYRYHQGADLLDASMTGVSDIESGDWIVPELTESVSEDEIGYITITVNNLSASETKDVEISFAEGQYHVSEATVVTGKLNAHNTFEAPETVREETFSAFKEDDGSFIVSFPPASVTLLRFEKK